MTICGLANVGDTTNASATAVCLGTKPAVRAAEADGTKQRLTLRRTDGGGVVAEAVSRTALSRGGSSADEVEELVGGGCQRRWRRRCLEGEKAKNPSRGLVVLVVRRMPLLLLFAGSLFENSPAVDAVGRPLRKVLFESGFCEKPLLTVRRGAGRCGGLTAAAVRVAGEELGWAADVRVCVVTLALVDWLVFLQ